MTFYVFIQCDANSMTVRLGRALWYLLMIWMKHPIPRSAFAGPFGRCHWWSVLCPGLLELSASLFWRHARKVASQAVAVWHLLEAAKDPMSASKKRAQWLWDLSQGCGCFWSSYSYVFIAWGIMRKISENEKRMKTMKCFVSSDRWWPQASNRWLRSWSWRFTTQVGFPDWSGNVWKRSLDLGREKNIKNTIQHQ